MGLRVVPQTKALLRVDDDYYYYYHCDDYRARLERKLVLQAQKVLQAKSPLSPKATPLLYTYAKPLRDKVVPHTTQVKSLKVNEVNPPQLPDKVALQAKQALHAKQMLQAKQTLQEQALLQTKSH